MKSVAIQGSINFVFLYDISNIQKKSVIIALVLKEHKIVYSIPTNRSYLLAKTIKIN